MIWTYADLMEHLADIHEHESDTRAQRNARRAVLRAYRDLPRYHNWAYLNGRRQVLTTLAAQSTGTVEYTHSTRTVELTGATWPADVVNYRFRLEGVEYEIESRTDDTNIVLPVENNPGADIAAGASYFIFQAAYPLPLGFRRMISVFDVDREYEIPMVSPQTNQRLAIQGWNTPDEPEYCTVIGSPDLLGEVALLFVPAPAASRQYDLCFDINPRPLRIERLQLAGDASIAAATKTVTFTATEIPEHAVGSVLRLSSDSALPTSLVGKGESDGTSTDHPAHVERMIVARPTASTVTLDQAIADDLDDVGFVISDPLDVDQGSMLTALQRFAEAEFCKLQKIGNPQERASYWQTFQRELLDAKAGDRKEVNYQRRGPNSIYDPTPITVTTIV